LPVLVSGATRRMSGKDRCMYDLLFIAIGFAAFFLTALYLPACDSL
jgi:hypothetical protein